VHVADAYAWALYANGDFTHAEAISRKAMALGYRNALFAFHAGMIQLRLGDKVAARRFLTEALSINPHFSIRWAPIAAERLATLDGAT
jgi:Flp pilus assembly protein TadD